MVVGDRIVFDLRCVVILMHTSTWNQNSWCVIRIVVRTPVSQNGNEHCHSDGPKMTQRFHQKQQHTNPQGRWGNKRRTTLATLARTRTATRASVTTLRRIRRVNTFDIKAERRPVGSNGSKRVCDG